MSLWCYCPAEHDWVPDGWCEGELVRDVRRVREVLGRRRGRGGNR